MSEATHQTHCSAPADEQIEVVKIKLIRKGGSAVVGEWHTADLLLAKWAKHPEEKSLGFEVVFGDGNALSGNYVFGERATGRPSLSRFIRRVFKQLTDEAEPVLETGCAFRMQPLNLARYALTHA